MDDRRRPSSPMRDLACLVRSLDHVARMAELRAAGARAARARRRRLDRARPGALHRRLHRDDRGVRHRPRVRPRAAAGVRAREGDVRVPVRRPVPAVVAVRAAARHALAVPARIIPGCTSPDSRPTSSGEPAALDALLDRYAAPGGPLGDVRWPTRAASCCSAWAARSSRRRRPRRCCAAAASTRTSSWRRPPSRSRPSRDTLAIGISASGGSAETVEALPATAARAARSPSRTTRRARSPSMQTWCCRCSPASRRAASPAARSRPRSPLLHLLAGVAGRRAAPRGRRRAGDRRRPRRVARRAARRRRRRPRLHDRAVRAALVRPAVGADVPRGAADRRPTAARPATGCTSTCT